jgi:ABC-type nitrate/sulfonate/bicarbonate transport system substrate-binding protein
MALMPPREARRLFLFWEDWVDVTRREFLKTSTAALLAGVPGGWASGVYAGDGPEAPKVRIGIIALTDCSSIVMAHELGLFKKYGIESTISKEASWAVIRDRLTLGENQATHMLLGIPYAATMGLQGSPVKPMIIPMYLNRNGQAITLTKALLEKGVKTPQQLKPLAYEAKAKGAPMTFAMTYPPGTHAMWTRYWLGAGGINPDRDVSLITIPPAQMVANMKVGKMDGYCVGEPWGARAIADGIGFTAITTQQIWRDHPEKVLAFTEVPSMRSSSDAWGRTVVVPAWPPRRWPAVSRRESASRGWRSSGSSRDLEILEIGAAEEAGPTEAPVVQSRPDGREPIRDPEDHALGPPRTHRAAGRAARPGLGRAQGRRWPRAGQRGRPTERAHAPPARQGGDLQARTRRATPVAGKFGRADAPW